MDEALQIERLARWCVSLTAIAACIFLAQCALDVTPATAAENDPPDTGIAILPRGCTLDSLHRPSCPEQIPPAHP